MPSLASDLILARLHALHPKSIDLSLGRIERLLAALDHPERRPFGERHTARFDCCPELRRQTEHVQVVEAERHRAHGVRRQQPLQDEPATPRHKVEVPDSALDHRSCQRNRRSREMEAADPEPVA